MNNIEITPGPGLNPSDFGIDLIMNKQRVNTDAFERIVKSSGSSQNQSQNQSQSQSRSSSGSGTPVFRAGNDAWPSGGGGDKSDFSYNNQNHNKSSFGRGDDDEDESEGVTEDFSEDSETMPSNIHSGQTNPYQQQMNLKSDEEINNEKRDLLYKFDRLESNGQTLPRKFTMQSDLEEMKADYFRLVKEKEVDASVRFQRMMLRTCVNGIEYLNSTFDPFDVHLSGWGETVTDNIQDYDDIFEELHEKYKLSGKKMAPELLLLLGVGGSAILFHLSHSMIKSATSRMPGVDDVLRNNPELMRQVSNAASKMGSKVGLGGQSQNSQSQNQGMPSNPMGMLGMLGSMFGASQQPASHRPAAEYYQQQQQQQQPMQPMQQQQQQQQQSMQRPMSGPTDLDSIMNQIHGSVSTKPQSGFDTISISDSEITSLIDDGGELNGLLQGKKRAAKKGKGQRTLHIV